MILKLDLVRLFSIENLGKLLAEDSEDGFVADATLPDVEDDEPTTV